MVQLVIDGIELPESQKGGYYPKEEPASVDVTMISGRTVRELRGNVWVISYQYGYFDDEMKNKVIEACKKGQSQSIRCGFLPPTSSGALSYSDFLVTSFTYPKFMWSRVAKNQSGEYAAVPMWADFTVELREVKPHD